MEKSGIHPQMSVTGTTRTKTVRAITLQRFCTCDSNPPLHENNCISGKYKEAVGPKNNLPTINDERRPRLSPSRATPQRGVDPCVTCKLHLLYFCFLSFLASNTIPSAIASGTGEWYHECNGGNCGYGNGGNSGSISTSCRDVDDRCANYARMGECFANPRWMHLNCQRSCGLCQDEEKDRDQDDSCVDKHSNCQTWGEEMECYANPAYMSGACPATCGICVNVHDLQKQGLSQEEIRQRQQFAETDFGLWQAIPKDSSNADAVRGHIRDMGRYIQQLQDEGRIGRGTACNNQYHDCAKWAAADTNDCESNINFMISHCSLICQYCHVVEQYHTCRQKKRSESEKPFHDVASVRTNLMTAYSGATNLAEGTCSASNQAQSDNDAEWVVSLEWRDLWGDDATVERATNELMKMLKNDKFQWIDARDHQDIAAVTYDGNEAMDRSGQILTISHQLSSEQPFQDFISRISQMLQIPRQNLEIEFVRYHKGERHAAHADYRIHDSWKPSGSRVLSIYVVLQRPDQGGNFGFPALHWLLVDNPKVLVWPNVRVEGDSIKPLSKLENEQLPVVDGELYAAHLWVHEYTFDPFGKCELGLK